MKKVYVKTLIVLVCLLTASLFLSTSYGLWKITSNADEIIATNNGCFEIIYSLDEISINDMKPLSNENGKTLTPYTYSIKNTCNEEKEVEIRLNVLDTNTLDIKGLTVFMTGDSLIEPTKYNILKNSRTTMEGVASSKILNNIVVKPNETIRTNLKLWLDEKEVSSVTANQVFNAIVEITDKETITLPTFKETILENNGGLNNITIKSAPDFNLVATNNEGLYATNDEDGISYYFRGAVTNNYVSFAGYLWRIIRINGDDTIRLIMQNSLESSEFNTNKNSTFYAGYTFSNKDGVENSNIKEILDRWYQENIISNNLNSFVATSKYCNDTNNYSEQYHIYYEPYNRIVKNINPSLNCQENSEDFGGKYRLKVGLISADEIVLAGANYNSVNPNIYLNNNTDFYTMTPSDYYQYSAYMMFLKADGTLDDVSVSQKKAIRPVISLKASTIVVGNGTVENPYKIDEDVL